MPITWTPLITGGSSFGWGMQFNAHSDFVGAVPTGTVMQFVYAGDSEGTLIAGQQSRIWNGTDILDTTDIRNGGLLRGNYSIPVGANVHVISQLIEPGGTVIDSGSVTLPFVQTSQDVFTIGSLSNSAGQGLTTAQAAQLTQVVGNTTTTQETASGTVSLSIGEMLGAKSIDTLTTQEITSGPQFGFVGHDLTAFAWGVLVTIATVGPEDAAITPDNDYRIRDLAVVRIFHGDSLYIRRPMHNTSMIVDMRPDKLSLVITAVEVALWPNSVTLQVNFAAGVSGQVFLLTLP